MRQLILRAATFALPLVMAGCGTTAEPNVTTGTPATGTANATSTTPGTAQPTSTGTASAPVKDETSCEADSDCAVVETECCDHCNGGNAAAYRKEAAPSHKKSGCEKAVCTERACAPVKPVCKDHKCAAVPDPQGAAGS